MFAEPIVINEWLFYDIRGCNGLHLQLRVEGFLETLKNGNDKIIVLKNSPWSEKAWNLWTSSDVRVQVLSKLLYLGILIDPLKTIYLSPDDVGDLPAPLAEQVPADDVYLFQCAITGGARIIVTTDERLKAMVTRARDFGIDLQLRDAFYLTFMGRPENV